MVALVTGGVDAGALPKLGCFVSPAPKEKGPADKGELKAAINDFDAVVLLGLVVLVGDGAFGKTFVAVGASLSDFPMAAFIKHKNI